MEVVRTIEALRAAVAAAKSEGKTVGLVPTMGALHQGHLSLIERSKEMDSFTVVSIFVNPTQFGPAEDFTRYPRPFEVDAEKCRKAGVDLIFAPLVEEVYPEGFATYVEVGGVTEMLEGAYRPGHFRGVATVVLKLFTAVEPKRAYFGMKDYQQLKVIQKMVRDLNLNIEIVPVPTFREPDGLAMSSRNAYLNPEERQAALCLYRALNIAREAVDAGERNAETVRQKALDVIQSEPLAKPDYVAVVDPETLMPVDCVDGPVLVALAVRIGNTRLIDNMLIGGQS
ncbi:MAG TPA: pantoate--beta-alanine ligase [Armatimonadota bacterium]|nr:pantoate--beta-alanine ligase [Armatimonadota bacterium]HOP79271.1 pantoate--beta-alanine ligase [Armatimonadota bacterium]